MGQIAARLVIQLVLIQTEQAVKQENVREQKWRNALDNLPDCFRQPTFRLIELSRIPGCKDP